MPLRLRIERLVQVTAGAALLAACGAEDHEAKTAGEPPTLESVIVQPERMPLERQFDGAVEAVNQGTVAAQTSGRVVAVFYDVNDFVPAGAVIVRLRATEQRTGLQQAQASLREASARETQARTHHRRIADMYERALVAKAALDEARADLDAAAAHSSAARAAVERAREGIAYTEIRAPYAGIVTRRHVEVGETVSPGTPIVTGLSLQQLRVTVDVPQSIVEPLRRTGKAVVYVNQGRVEAKKLTVFPAASTISNTFRVRLELPENLSGLYPGMLVKTGFVLGEADRLLVPAQALVERGELTAVYVIDPGGSTSLRQVRTGRRFADRVEILAGLAAGARVALDPGAAMKRLKPARGASEPSP